MENNENRNPNIVIRFHQTPQTRIYMCRRCRTHIVFSRNRVTPLADAIMCQNPVNVRASNVPYFWDVNRLAVLDVFCNECNLELGKKYARGRQAATPVFQGGTFILSLDRMLYWNGNQLVYADTRQPARGN